MKSVKTFLIVLLSTTLSPTAAFAKCSFILMTFSNHGFTGQLHDTVREIARKNPRVQRTVAASMAQNAFFQLSDLGVLDDDLDSALLMKIATLDQGQGTQSTVLKYQSVKGHRFASEETQVFEWRTDRTNTTLGKRQKREVRRTIEKALQTHCSQ
jgi:hypothetical protein